TPSLAALVQSQHSDRSARFIDSAVGQCLRSLKKLGLRDELFRLLERLGQLILEKEKGGLAAMIARPVETGWLYKLRVLVQLAGGRMSLRQMDRASPILEACRRVLYEGPLQRNDHLLALEKRKLTSTCATVLGEAPIEMAVPRIEELFTRVGNLPN